jgi:LPXTG-motif cell wall-anchored protein
MKKIVFIIILLVSVFYNVYAKDISYSMNKFDVEAFNYIEKSYDSELKEDGYVLGGSVLKEKIEKDETTYNDYQVILVKYDKNDKLVWKYMYGNTSEDYIDYLTYTYDADGNIDGYLIVTKKTYDINEPNIGGTSVIIKIDFDGKVVYERDINEGVITKIIPTYVDNNFDGYISILNTQTGASLIKYNKDFDIILKRDFNETSLYDLTIIKQDGKIVGYAVIEGNNLISLDINGSNDSVISDVSKYKTYNLAETNNGFILYGITNEVKLDKGDSSYYLINYADNNEVWETIGDTPASSDDKAILLPIYKDSNIKEYLLLYKNEVDSSYEVIKINLDGEVIKKVKKINNSYYDFESFTSTGNTIYFVGQINCPDDESCEFDNNSLYLVSDEDKVIEVKDDASMNTIIIGGIVFIVLVGGIIFIRKKRKK